MAEPINVISLFDGMSCLQIALNELGCNIENYYASEIDKHAIKSTQYLFPNTIQVGSVIDFDVRKMPKIHVIGGGSPCTDFSFSGKMKGMVSNEKFEQPSEKEYQEWVYLEEKGINPNPFIDYEDYVEQKRVEFENKHRNKIEVLTLEHYLQLKSEGFQFEGQSYLFWEYMRVLRDIQKYNNPDVIFFLENVVMTEKWESILTRAIGVKPIMINAAQVSAQQRKRLYWTNIGQKPSGLFGDLEQTIPQPKDRGILLKHILETDVADKYYLSEKIIKGFIRHTQNMKEKGNGFAWNPKDGSEKGNCLTARSYKMGVDDNYIAASRGRNPENPKSRKSGQPTEQRLEPRNDGKTNCLTSVQKDNLVIQLNPCTKSGGKQPYQQDRIYDAEGISPALCAYKADLLIRESGLKTIGMKVIGNVYQSGGQAGKVVDVNFKSPPVTGQRVNSQGFMEVENTRIRRLTPTEAGRLQSVPEHYIKKMIECGTSDTQLYRMYGNGWNIEVIKYIFSFSTLCNTENK